MNINLKHNAPCICNKINQFKSFLCDFIEDSHFWSNKEFRNIEEQSKFQGDSVHSSLKRNINQLHSKKIKIQTKFSHDFVALNTIEEGKYNFDH